MPESTLHARPAGPAGAAAPVPSRRRGARPASWTGVAVYAAGVLTLSTLGGIAITADPAGGAGAGALLFVVSPTVMAVALRTLGREGWADAGLGLGRRRRWYLAGAVVPGALAVAVLTGVLAGAVTPAPGGGGRFAALLAAGLVARVAFAALEELGWRGYLEPRLAALGVRGLRRHLAVGALWAVWHVPYVVALGPQYTPLPLLVQLPLFAAAVLAMAVLWGVMRERTGSVWPAVLGHGLANAVAFPLLDPRVAVIDDVLLFAARPESLVALGCLVAAAAVVQVRRGPSAGHSARPAAD